MDEQSFMEQRSFELCREKSDNIRSDKMQKGAYPVTRRLGVIKMVKPIMKDVFFLAQKSEPATSADTGVIIDLLDTLAANTERCVGMAANMIGVRKNIIAVNVGFVNLAMVNPKIVKKDTPYETEEGCLSLEGMRKTVRYENIEVEYQDHNFVKKCQNFSGWTAQIIQHEIDHCNGILI